MTINFTFDNIDEMEAAVLHLAEGIMARQEPQPITYEEASETEEAPIEEPAAEPIVEEPVKEEPKISRTDMRKILSALNKSTGENTARKLISEMGYKALTDVPDDKLPELKAKAEEVLNAV